MPWKWITNYLRNIFIPCLANVHKNASWIDSLYCVTQQYNLQTFPFEDDIETLFFSLGYLFSVEKGKQCTADEL